MKSLKTKRFVSVLLCLLLLWPAAVGAQTIKQNFEWIVAKQLTVTTGSATLQSGSLTLTAGNIIATAGSASLGNDLSVADDATIGSDLITSKQTAVTVTSGGTITPTGTYQLLTSASTVGTSSVAGCTSGRVLVLANSGSNTITLTDTGTLKLGGNAALGATDTLTLICDGTNWNQVSKADN
jgi:hypothetical protein